MKGVLVKVRDRRAQYGREEWVHHDRLSSPSLFAANAKPDVRADPPVDPDDENYRPEDVGSDVSPPSGTSETEDRTSDNNSGTHNPNPVSVTQRSTRSGRTVRANTNPDFVYEGFFVLKMELVGVAIPPDLTNQSSEVWHKAKTEQRICRMGGLQPSEYAFLRRRTGTLYVLDPNVALFVAKVSTWQSPFAYLVEDEPEPWEDADNAVPGPPLLDEQLVLPSSVDGFTSDAAADRRSPVYGLSTAWSIVHPWLIIYRLLRDSMQQSAARRQAAPSRLRLPTAGSTRHAVGPSSVAFGDSARQAPSPSMLGAMESHANPEVRAFAAQWKARHPQQMATGSPHSPTQQSRSKRLESVSRRSESPHRCYHSIPRRHSYRRLARSMRCFKDSRWWRMKRHNGVPDLEPSSNSRRWPSAIARLSHNFERPCHPRRLTCFKHRIRKYSHHQRLAPRSRTVTSSHVSSSNSGRRRRE